MRDSDLSGEKFFTSLTREGLTPEQIVKTINNDHEPLFEVDTGRTFLVTASHNNPTGSVALSKADGTVWRAITTMKYHELLNNGRLLLHSWDMQPIIVKTVE